MLDHTVHDALRLTGDARLTFTSLDGLDHAVIDARGIGGDGVDMLNRFLTGRTDDPAALADRFRDAWEHGFAREAVSMLAGICTVRLDLGIDLTGQADRQPVIASRLTVTDEDVREYVAGQDRVPGNIAFHYIMDELRQSEDADVKRRLKTLILGGCMNTVF